MSRSGAARPRAGAAAAKTRGIAIRPAHRPGRVNASRRL